MFRVQKASAQKDSRRGFETPRAVRHEFNSDVVAVLDLIKGKGLICGSDLNIEAALDNTEKLPFGDRIELVKSDFKDLKDLNNMTIVSNPPYGIRLNKEDDPGLFMKDIGDFLKQKCTGSDAWIYVGSTSLLKRVGLRSSKRIILNNGGLDGRLAHFEMYSGTRDP